MTLDLDTTIALRERYLQLLDDMADLHIRKNSGYAGESKDPWANFRMSEAFGVPSLIGVMVRLTDKWIRADNLNKNPSLDKVGESLKDTLMDFAAYSLIAVCLWRERKYGRKQDFTPTQGDPEYLSLLDELQVYQPPRKTFQEAFAFIGEIFEQVTKYANVWRSPTLPHLLEQQAAYALYAICLMVGTTVTSDEADYVST